MGATQYSGSSLALAVSELPEPEFMDEGESADALIE